MSALGHKRIYAAHQPMSALHPIATTKADMCGALGHVCFGPIADIIGETLARLIGDDANRTVLDGRYFESVLFCTVPSPHWL